jgi:hypothetical protein
LSPLGFTSVRFAALRFAAFRFAIDTPPSAAICKANAFMSSILRFS